MIILWIVPDSMRKDYITANEYQREMPWLKELIDDSLFFENAYSQASFTTFSFASFITGKYPWNIYRVLNKDEEKDSWSHNNFKPFPKNLRTIFNLASEAGFECLSFTRPILGEEYNYIRWGLFSDWKQHSGAAVYPYAEPILKNIQELHKSCKDALILIRTSDTHIPWTARDKMTEDGLRDRSWSGVINFITKLVQSGEGDRVKRYIRQGLIRLDSELLNPVLALLIDLGIYDDCTILLHSDHGDLLWDRYASNNDTAPVGHNDYVWQSVINVPLIIKFPRGFELAGSCKELFELRDVYFILSWLITKYCYSRNNATKWEDLPDTSFLLLPRRYAIGSSISDLAYCTNGSMKLIYDKKTKQKKLFNIDKDYNEVVDLCYEQHIVAEELLNVLTNIISDWTLPCSIGPNMNAMLRLLGYIE